MQHVHIFHPPDLRRQKTHRCAHSNSRANGIRTKCISGCISAKGITCYTTSSFQRIVNVIEVGILKVTISGVIMSSTSAIHRQRDSSIQDHHPDNCVFHFVQVCASKLFYHQYRCKGSVAFASVVCLASTQVASVFNIIVCGCQSSL